jgi:hypothetical protein
MSMSGDDDNEMMDGVDESPVKTTAIDTWEEVFGDQSLAYKPSENVREAYGAFESLTKGEVEEDIPLVPDAGETPPTEQQEIPSGDEAESSGEGETETPPESEPENSGSVPAADDPTLWTDAAAMGVSIADAVALNSSAPGALRQYLTGLRNGQQPPQPQGFQVKELSQEVLDNLDPEVAGMFQETRAQMAEMAKLLSQHQQSQQALLEQARVEQQKATSNSFDSFLNGLGIDDLGKGGVFLGGLKPEQIQKREAVFREAQAIVLGKAQLGEQISQEEAWRRASVSLGYQPHASPPPAKASPVKNGASLNRSTVSGASRPKVGEESAMERIRQFKQKHGV